MILFAGAYTEEVGPGLSGSGIGICSFQFNNTTGELSLLHSYKNRNTGYLCITKNKKFLYTFQEVSSLENPVVLAFEIQPDFSLKEINRLPISGGLPCHISLLNKDELVGVTCYQTGTVNIFSLDENGFLIDEIQVIQHLGNSVNKARQECAHAHMIVENQQEIFVPDLGIDAIVTYKFSQEKKLTLVENTKINIPKGEGPRHVVFHPSNNFAYVMNELTGSISILEKSDNTFSVEEVVNSLPSSYEGTPSGAAIKMSFDGKFLYASNRGSNTIAIFSVNSETGYLTLINQQEVFGITPRDFTISPNNKWLIVANQDTNNLVVFKRNETSGELNKQFELKGVNSVVCLQWL